MRGEGYSSCLVCVSVCLSVCLLSVCLSAHAILAVRAIKSITKDTIVLSVRFAAILYGAPFVSKLFKNTIFVNIPSDLQISISIYKYPFRFINIFSDL